MSKKTLSKAKEPTQNSAAGIKRQSAESLPLTRINFILMACSGALIVLGFLLMLGGSSGPEGFNPDIFSTRRIVVGPALAFIGFVAMGVAIIYRPCAHRNQEKPTNESPDTNND